MNTAVSDAQRLKEEGNALFGKKQFRAAMAKYSAAMELDGTNAVLFANRAACLLGLTRFMEAEVDARKATKLDPGYPKAWARLATAKEELSLWEHAIESWTHAIDAFSKDEELSAAEQTQKDLYTENLKRAQATLKGKFETLDAFRLGIRSDQGKLPWQRANEIYLSGCSVPTNSSVWVIMFAYGEWQRGIEGLKKLTKRGDCMQGEILVIESLSNGILRDQRALCISMPNFPTRYDEQVTYETMLYKANWTELDSKTVLEEATARLRSETWDTVRPALEFTVRIIFMRAYLVYIANQDCGAALTEYNTCLEILEAGMKLWPNVAHELVFCRSFARSVKALRTEAYMGAYKASPKRYSLEQLERDSIELYEDAVSDPLPPSYFDPGFALSFWAYPRGQALATSAWCARERAGFCTTSEEKQVLLTAAGKLYDDAAKVYPEDDESRGCFLLAGVECYEEAKAPVSTILPLLVMMKNHVPKMKKIWEHSASTLGGRDEGFEGLLQLEKEVQQKLAEGSIKMSSTLEDL